MDELLNVPDELLRVPEAQRLMKVGRDTVYQLVATGEIPSVRLGRQIRIPRAALLGHLERRALEQTGSAAAGDG